MKIINNPAVKLLFIFLIFYMTDSYAEIRKPAVAGAFYPGKNEELKKMISGHLSGVETMPAIDGQVIALLVPHAGLVYSGQIAAHAYKILENSGIKRVILCGPSHRYRFNGLSVYGPGVQWETPLGMIACNDDLCQHLLNFNKNVNVIPEAHYQEHCLEVQLPYLQTVLTRPEIVPVLIGPQDHGTVKLLSEALQSLPFDSQTVMIASSDWQHYRPASEGWKYDSTGIKCLEDLDPDRLENYLQTGKVEMCGGGVTVAVVKAALAKGANRLKILKYGDSGDVSGDKTAVVGYVAAVLYKADEKENDSRKTDVKKTSNMEKDLEKYELSDTDKKQLLQIARRSIESYLADGTIPEFEVPGNLSLPGAAFVTLEKGETLRGCIGHVMAVEPLYKTVATCAVQAAVSDPRFPPVQAREMKDIHIEISVLTPQQKVASLDEIEVGRDGLVIAMGNNRGLLLPQVATDYGWNKTEFLQHTCRKAGLPIDAYKSPEASIYKFQALVFGE